MPQPTSHRSETISLNLGAIFRLLPASVVHHAYMPDAHARVVLPLGWLEPQMAGGHVEIPLADFANALPAKMAAMLQTEVDEKVWIPLDEILQNLPAHHPFHFGEMELLVVSENYVAEITPIFETKIEEAQIVAEPILPAPEKVEPLSPEKLLVNELAQLPGIHAAAVASAGQIAVSDHFPAELHPEILNEQLPALERAASLLARDLGWKNQLLLPCGEFSLSVYFCESEFILALHRAALDAETEEKLRAAVR